MCLIALSWWVKWGIEECVVSVEVSGSIAKSGEETIVAALWLVLICLWFWWVEGGV